MKRNHPFIVIVIDADNEKALRKLLGILDKLFGYSFIGNDCLKLGEFNNIEKFGNNSFTVNCSDNACSAAYGKIRNAPFIAVSCAKPDMAIFKTEFFG